MNYDDFLVITKTVEFIYIICLSGTAYILFCRICDKEEERYHLII